jgi:hypothetical protein
LEIFPGTLHAALALSGKGGSISTSEDAYATTT